MGRTIAFLTDLGYADDAVGMCKGMLLQRSPGSQIIDITHQVSPFDVQEAAHYLADLPPYFPDDTVFCSVIYPETGTLPCVVARNDCGQLFVAADNGLLSLVAGTTPFQAVHRIENPDCVVSPPTPSFYGRDVIVACAGVLAAGFPLEQVGPAQQTVRQLDVTPSELLPTGDVSGQVSIIDRNFGNIWTNIPEKLCADGGLAFGADLLVEFDGLGAFRFPFRETFGNVSVGGTLAYLNSRNRLAFASNQGNLRDTVPAAPGTPVRVRRADSDTLEHG